MKLPAFLILALLTPGCSALQNAVPTPKARIQSVDVKGLSLTAVTLLFDVEVDNPYSRAIPVVNIEYALASDEKRFLEGTSEAEHSIPADGSAVIPMAVSLPFQALIDAGRQVKPGAVIPYRADLALHIDTPVLGIVRVPAGRDGEIRIPSFP